MQNNDKKYFIPVNRTPIEVSEEVYRAYYQPIWNTRYHAQQNGECRCTKAQLWKCDGVCPGCSFCAAGKKVSIDTPIGGENDELTLGDTLADEAPSAESILMDKELLDALYEELNRLDPDGRRICELIMQGKTEREIAADMGKRQSTINYQKNKVFSILRTEDSKTTQVLRKEEPPMSESRPNKAVTDEELIGVLTAISVVSKRLARKLIQLNQTSQSQEGGNHDEQNERNGSDHQRVTGCCIFY